MERLGDGRSLVTVDRQQSCEPGAGAWLPTQRLLLTVWELSDHLQSVWPGAPVPTIGEGKRAAFSIAVLLCYADVGVPKVTERPCCSLIGSTATATAHGVGLVASQ